MAERGVSAFAINAGKAQSVNGTAAQTAVPFLFHSTPGNGKRQARERQWRRGEKKAPQNESGPPSVPDGTGEFPRYCVAGAGRGRAGAVVLVRDGGE
jgi:hypothetical protein